MPVIVAGQSGARWGLSPSTGMIAQRAHSSSHIEKNEGDDANGEVGMVSYFNSTRNVDVGGIWLGAAPSLGTAFSAAFLAVGAPGGSVFCEGIDMDEVNVEFTKIDIHGFQYQNI